jgi:hypothetical protein
MRPDLSARRVVSLPLTPAAGHIASAGAATARAPAPAGSWHGSPSACDSTTKCCSSTVPAGRQEPSRLPHWRTLHHRHSAAHRHEATGAARRSDDLRGDAVFLGCCIAEVAEGRSFRQSRWPGQDQLGTADAVGVLALAPAQRDRAPAQCGRGAPAPWRCLCGFHGRPRPQRFNEAHRQAGGDWEFFILPPGGVNRRPKAISQ